MLNKLFASKTYHYFDSYAQLQSQELNFIQIVLRKLGFFKHTHLDEVVKKGYEHTISGRFNAKPYKEKALLKLFSKSHYEHKLPFCGDAALSVKYLASAGKIDMVYFKLNRQEIRFLRLEDRYVISIPSFEGKIQDTPESIQERFNSEEAKTLSQLAYLILHDSSASPLASYFRLHATDYYSLPSNYKWPSEANTLQAKELCNLGWIYERLLKDTVSKSSYRPQGKPLENYRTLSLSFAMNHL